MQVVLHSTYFHVFIIILVILDALTVLCELLLDVGAFGKCMEGREGRGREGRGREEGEMERTVAKYGSLDSERDRDRDRVSHLEDTTLLWFPW